MNWDMKSLKQILKEEQEIPKGRMAIVTHTVHGRNGEPGSPGAYYDSTEIPAGSVVMLLDVHEDQWNNKRAVVFWNEQRLFASPSYFFMVNPENKFGNKAFAITGTLHNQREFYKALIKFKGGIWKNSVSRKTDFLIASKSGRVTQTTKYKKAVRLGTKVISEEELGQLLSQ